MSATGEVLEVTGRVVEALPNALYRVEIMTGPRREVTAHATGEALLRVRAGEAVVVELSPYDPGRGRIVRRQG